MSYVGNTAAKSNETLIQSEAISSSHLFSGEGIGFFFCVYLRLSGVQNGLTDAEYTPDICEILCNPFIGNHQYTQYIFQNTHPTSSSTQPGASTLSHMDLLVYPLQRSTRLERGAFSGITNYRLALDKFFSRSGDRIFWLSLSGWTYTTNAAPACVIDPWRHIYQAPPPWNILSEKQFKQHPIWLRP